MARLTALPSVDIIHGFHGVIDFYLWKGLACARRWPRLPKSRQSPATRAAAVTFGAMLAAYHLLGPSLYAAFTEDAKDQTRTPRDIWMSALHGKLHEASMSDFLDLLIECRDFLSDLTALLNALGTVDTDDIQVDVKTSALPTLAATATHQVTQNTALATIAKLEAALRSVDTDALQVRGTDQLFSIKGVITHKVSGFPSGDDGYQGTPGVPAGEYHVVTTITARDLTTPLTAMTFYNRHNGTDVCLDAWIEALAAGTRRVWHGWTLLDVDDWIKVLYTGCLATDTVEVDITGYRITVET